MVAASMTASPLQDNGVIRVSCGNGDNLTDAVDGARLEHDILDARVSKCTNYLCRLLSATVYQQQHRTLQWVDLHTSSLAIGGTGSRTDVG